MRSIRLISVALLAATVVSCESLDTTNPNNPNRETVVTNSQDVLSLISNGFLQWFNRSAGTSPAVALSTMADEFSSGFADFGGLDLSREPREAVNNGVPSNNPPPHHATFPDYYTNIAALNQALKAMEDIPVLRNSTGQDVTVEAHAFAKFMQGLNHGYVALMHDQGYVFSEAVDSDTLGFMGGEQEVQGLLRPYGEVMDTALAELNEALQLAASKSFTYPASAPNAWFLGYTRTNQDLIRIIHSYMARLMVYVARNPQERQAVNWTEVLQHLDQGLTTDLEVMGVIGVVETLYKQRAARQRTTTPSDFMRVDYRVVGPSDQSQGYINWWNKQPWFDRAPFKMNTADKRIDGVTPRPATCQQAPSSATCGLYMGYHNSTVFNAARGLGLRSFYFFHRYGAGTSWQSGPIPIITMAELDLIRAEALIRLGRAEEAVPLINKYRVANGQLPPVTLDGVPGTAPNCAPRKVSGECGSLWDALIYEKRIETMGVEGGTAYYDARAWDFLVKDTPIHFPIPLRDLELLGMTIYTFGGAGGTDGAPEPNWEKCPVALPRCP